ncbi:MAG: YidC/Oxa1 family membrane protein insertase [Acidimicrobiia bacterium]
MILAAGSIFDPVYNFFGAILAFFYSLFPNPDYGLGIAIILLTFLVMLVTFPLTAKQAKSMMAMQRAQPEIKKLQAKYKNDRAKLNEEMMKYYQENKINPLAGCLPLLIQMPIFLALFRVMREPYKHIPKSSQLYAAFCTTPNGKLHTDQCNVPKLGLPNPLYFLNLNLSLSATQAKGALVDTLPYFFLVGLVILTGFLQARQSRRNAPNMNTQMAMITSILPIGFGLFSLGFPSGLVLYFFVSNTWRLGQQELIMRKITRPAQEAMKAEQQKAIDVEGADSGTKTATAEKPASGGLRKLFQLPAASEGGNGATKGGAKGTKPSGAKSTGAKPGQKQGAKPAAKSGSSGGSSGSSSGGGSGGGSSSSRRRNNKKRKKR